MRKHEAVITVVADRCVYVNDLRVAGGKPYMSENLSQKTYTVPADQLLRAVERRNPKRNRSMFTFTLDSEDIKTIADRRDSILSLKARFPWNELVAQVVLIFPDTHTTTIELQPNKSDTVGNTLRDLIVGEYPAYRHLHDRIADMKYCTVVVVTDREAKKARDLEKIE